ncbi:YecR-like lipofamily protein [Citrobacter koseri]|uniref:YecR-like lipofamily protein n=1 Tax=Citrobacter koseri TaxID=545 RepID=UPI002942AB42|nr:YecR-like lipofamily protein [Citrobacter koseri]MEB2702729.1 YecR-like lipofamily protein [Citrobacter koseri]MEB2708125.1 YecR-like lipofamily protein [Citrobacter koseri]MEB2772539.1 YecR-like lipofamily protein [Citrobacter koseri]WOJ28093.1 YecR-like lipofamily protein [Citrobacter koseri]
MKTFILGLSLITLTGCTLTKQAQVSETNPTSGIVRLSYNQAMMQTARADDYVAHGTATRECQQMGYANAIAFGQPVSTCSVYAGSLCMNTRITLSYQCQGVAIQPISVGGY